jgi:hypothetical protein
VIEARVEVAAGYTLVAMENAVTGVLNGTTVTLDAPVLGSTPVYEGARRDREAPVHRDASL